MTTQMGVVAMHAYHLMTLDAKTMLEKAQVVRQEDGKHRAVFRFDFSAGGRGLADEDIILSVDRCSDNALFYQIRQCLKTQGTKADLPEDDDGKEACDCLRRSLIFLDFQNVSFQAEDDKLKKRYQDLNEKDLLSKEGHRARLQWLFDKRNGIELTFDDGVPRNFVPFDKSGSMARSGRISFIDKTLLKELEKRLLLDIDFSKINLTPSKYYAYRGLYLSTGYRLEQEGAFCFDEESVLVLEDDTADIEDVQIFSNVGEQPPDEETLWQFGVCKNRQRVKVNPFDGEGLICPAYARHINERLKIRYGFSRDSHSFQIRMPFTKGMLHEVDFEQFFAEFGGDGALYIQDAFDIRRDLRKAKIILTKSMFKCCGWLKRYWKNHSNTAQADSEARKENIRLDPMQHVFQKMQEYGHTLYVSGTDARLSRKKRVRLNYQFFSTLDIEPESFLQLIANERKTIRRLQEAPTEADGMFSLPAEDDDASILAESTANFSLPENEAAESAEGKPALPEEDASTNREESSWTDRENARDKYWAALKRNPAFLSDKHVKDFVRETIRNLEKNLCLGKFAVLGENRYLSGDLLSLLFYILQKTENLPPDKKEKLKKLSKSLCLLPDKFYLPQASAQPTEDSCCAILRSPHLSRNEQCLLIPHRETDGPYRRYFSHLVGIVMTAKSSFVPMALGGADFDGDLVKIIREEAVIEAVKRKVYQEEGGKYTRTLPVIQIPSAKQKSEILTPSSIPFETVANTFSNRIGQISNIAVKIAKREYWEGKESSHEFRNKCAECTIVTGLEIDAAKTGLHPNANIKALETCVKKEESFFLQTKKASEKIYAGYAEPQIVPSKGQGALSLALRKKKKFLLSDIPVYDKTAAVANLERIPGEYLKCLAEKPQKFSWEKNKARDCILFRFQGEGNGSAPLDKEKLQQTSRLSQAYIALGKLDYRLKRSRAFYEDSDYANRVGFLLKLQYDSRQTPLPCGVSVEEAQRQAYAALEGTFTSEAEVRDALVRLLDEKWQFAKEEQREEKIARILNLGKDEMLPQAVIELLSNFRNGGYMIFYYILKDVRRHFRENMDIATYMDGDGNPQEKSRFPIPKGNPYWEELYQTYCKASAKKETASVWRRKIQDLCRSHLMNIFGENMNTALLHAANEKSKSRFLWDVFSKEEILRNIHSPEVQNIEEDTNRKGGGSYAG